MIYSKLRQTNFGVNLHGHDKVIPANATKHFTMQLTKLKKYFFYQKGIIGIVNPSMHNVPKWSDTP